MGVFLTKVQTHIIWFVLFYKKVCWVDFGYNTRDSLSCNGKPCSYTFRSNCCLYIVNKWNIDCTLNPWDLTNKKWLSWVTISYVQRNITCLYKESIDNDICSYLDKKIHFQFI